MTQTVSERISQLQHEVAVVKSNNRDLVRYIDKLENYIMKPWYVRLFTPRPF